MIHDQSLPMFLWAEASRTVVYVQNKCLDRILKNMTLEESFTSEAKSGPPSYLWLSGLHTCAQGEKDEIRAVGKEGEFYGI